MKALLIANSARTIDNISQVLEAAGYDVIIYRWLLKALDNIEEISPHLIIISAKEYPRHWKILAQFATAFFTSYQPQIILYAQGGLDDEERKKADILKVRGIFDSVDVKGLDKLREILLKEEDVFSGTLADVKKNSSLDNADIQQMEKKEESLEELEQDKTEQHVLEPNETAPSSICGFIFENPVSGSIVTGYAHGFDGNCLHFESDIPEFTRDLQSGTKIYNATLENYDNCMGVQAVIRENTGPLVLEIC